MQIIIVTGHARVRDSLARLLRRESWIDAVVEVGSARDAVAWLRTGDADVAIVDAGLASEAGIDTSRQLSALDQPPRIILLASFVDGDLRRRAFDAGVSSLLSKELDVRPLLDAIRGAP
jgi:DNA-binding NarL/FixJ family response regulator